jgi:hypothetical protein
MLAHYASKATLLAHGGPRGRPIGTAQNVLNLPPSTGTTAPLT